MKQMDTYNLYIEQEDNYYKQLETIEQCQSAIFDYIYRSGSRCDKLTVQDILLSVHHLEDSIRVQLLHLKLEKAYLAYVMKKPT
ncbi:hypothetical protein [Paenibacillus pinihumi]|uniref:hypothetical protein n=1 Tax=Paenibacillus pinihumi TaxID=669462 RepID=UPI000406778E|nr:hypothetical protein [Paenibacillus pinihumi]